jgi:hypothetical protein
MELPGNPPKGTFIQLPYHKRFKVFPVGVGNVELLETFKEDYRISIFKGGREHWGINILFFLLLPSNPKHC